MIKPKPKAVLYGILSSIAFFIISGITTNLIPNDIFIRMTPIIFTDYVFLTLTSILIGIFTSLFYYHKTKSKLCNIAATGGGVLGFLSFSCTICNKILVLILGATGVLIYIEPYRHILGALGIIVLSITIVVKIHDIKQLNRLY